jgi:hypothetical protein
MKFGRYLESQARPEWRENYVDYKGLKKLITASVREDSTRDAGSPRNASLSVARDPRIAAEEQFHLRLEDEMEKARITLRHRCAAWISGALPQQLPITAVLPRACCTQQHATAASTVTAMQYGWDHRRSRLPM